MGLVNSFRSDMGIGSVSFGSDIVGAGSVNFRDNLGMGLTSTFRGNTGPSSVGAFGMGSSSSGLRNDMGTCNAEHETTYLRRPPGLGATADASGKRDSISSFRSDARTVPTFKSEQPFSPVASSQKLGISTPLIVDPATPYMSEGVTEITLPKAHHHQATVSGHSQPTSHPSSNSPNSSMLGSPLFHASHGRASSMPVVVPPNPVVPLADLAKMSRWEIEQLYYYNAAIMEQQKKLMQVIEKHLAKAEGEPNVGFHKPTSFEVYRKFIDYLTEPETVATADLMYGSFGYREEPQGINMASGHPAGGIPHSPAGNIPHSPAGGIPHSPAGNIPHSPAGNIPHIPAGNIPHIPAGGIPTGIFSGMYKHK
jgi:hypothetical protein